MPLIISSNYPAKIHPRNQYPLFFTVQLLAKNQEFMITWSQYKQLAGLNLQGKKASWYRTLEMAIIDTSQSGSRMVKSSINPINGPVVNLTKLLPTPSTKRS